MPSNNIIDLFSTDDEANPPAVNVAKVGAAGTDTTNAYSVPGSREFANIGDFDNDWPQQAPKRRRFSPLPAGGVDTHTPPALSHLRSKAPSHRPLARPEPPNSRNKPPLHNSDPIIFTSSPVYHVPRSKRRAPERTLSDSDLSDDSLPEDVVLAAIHSKSSGLSSRTAALLDSLSHHRPGQKPTGEPKRSVKLPVKSSNGQSHENDDARNPSGTEERSPPSRKGTKPSRKPKLTEDEKATKAKEKETESNIKRQEQENAKAASKELKAREREEDKERKKLLKEEKAREKRIAADLAEANKSKLDKKDSTPEMIVDLPASIDGKTIHTQVKQMLQNLDVDTTLYQSLIPHVIKWRRKMKAKWNTELNHWKPLEQMEIHEEKHIMCLIAAKEFISLATERGNDQDLKTHVTKLKSAYDGCTPIYLIEGLQSAMKKNKTAENRAYQAKVNALNQNQNQADIINEDLIEDTLLRLQVTHNCLIHHTSTTVESAEWIANFTQHISTIPYRAQRMNLSTTFCMDSGQVKTGEDKADTFVKMLQEVVRVTPPIAYGIAGEYPSVVALVEAFKRRGPGVLENLQKSANKNGAITERRIGPAISRRLYKVFMEGDPESTDV